MEHQTVVGFSILMEDLVDENTGELLSAFEKLKKLKQLIVEKDKTYSFQVLRNGTVYTVNTGLEKEFDDFISHIQSGVKLDEELGYYTLTTGEYVGELVDIEEGEINFEESFVIHDEGLSVYLNTQAWYSSELEKISSNLPIGLDGEMNDTDGDYYYFTL